jgi:hypothetical protein
VQARSRQDESRFGTKGLIASLCVLLVLFLSVVAVDSALHGSVHEDASSASHQCLITSFAKAQVHQVAIGEAIQAWVLFAFYLLPATEQLPLLAPAHQLPPSCGPPSSLV